VFAVWKWPAQACKCGQVAVLCINGRASSSLSHVEGGSVGAEGGAGRRHRERLRRPHHGLFGDAGDGARHQQFEAAARALEAEPRPRARPRVDARVPLGGERNLAQGGERARQLAGAQHAAQHRRRARHAQHLRISRNDAISHDFRACAVDFRSQRACAVRFSQTSDLVGKL
jgi:hypothetical protein